MRKLLLLIFIFPACKDKHSPPVAPATVKQQPSELDMLGERFHRRIDSTIRLAKAFTKTHGYNQEYVFIADLSLHSGFERFAVVDMKRDTIIRTGLVAHGAGGKYWTGKVRFSNVPNSWCSSPGRYRIGNKYDGQFGPAYKLHGLDSTNSHAYERFIVLHAYDCVSDKTIYPVILCNSEGCPMVSYKFLTYLSGYIDKSRKPLLLWIIG